MQKNVRLASLRNKIAAGVAGASASGMALAAGPDYTTLTTAVDFGSTSTALLAVAAALVVVYITWKGAKLVLQAVKGG